MTRDTYLKRSLGTQAKRIKEVRMLSTLNPTGLDSVSLVYLGLRLCR